MSQSQLRALDLPYDLQAYQAMNLQLESDQLKGNPLGDPSFRHNYLLVPKKLKENLPVIFHLSGYFSTGYQGFHTKTLQANFVESIDQGAHQHLFPKALHVFVEASTFWGGSQFIDSYGCGSYARYILRELYPALSGHFSISKKLSENCLMGGSSGGYGALSLISEKDSPFGLAVAVAPDSFFEASLLPSLFATAPELEKYKSFNKIKKLLKQGEIQDKKSFFNLVNAIAMAHCYAPKETFKKDFIEFPVDLYSGAINKKIWNAWLKHDPINFLSKRKNNLAGKEIFMDVGRYDNFSLQFGTRQIAEVLKNLKVKNHYSEFSGNHFGLSKRKLLFMETLSKRWRKFV